DTGIPVHFDCVSAKIASGENLEKGDIIAYIGGGRFGIVNFAGKDQGRAFSQSQATGSPDSAYSRVFTIKKVIEWENKDKRAEWRGEICSHYSET
ncbi:MAG: hypothetical protein FWH35_10630, partial [Treponema sp.]|nr:hypothetical protein [Treponema sp.]